MNGFKTFSRLSLLLLTFSLQVLYSKTVTQSGLYENSKGSPIVDIIKNAKKSLHMEIYEMDDPKVIAAIRGALNRNVKVKIVREPDPVGAKCKVFDASGNIMQQGKSGSAECDDQIALVEDVIEAGGQYVPFDKEELCEETSRINCLEHGKLAVADSEIALISSGNFNTTSLCDLEHSPDKCNRDYSYVTDDPSSVRSFVNIVNKDINGKSYELDKVIEAEAENKLTVGPNSLSPLVSLIKSAKKSIQVQNQYLKDPTLNEALIDMAKKGVKVYINVASACAFGTPSETESEKLTDIFTEFEDAGIEISMFTKKIKVNGKQGYLHAKAIAVDGKKAWIGSVNGSTQAVTKNREFGVFFDDSLDVQKLTAQMTKDFNDENSETWEDSLACAEND